MTDLLPCPFCGAQAFLFKKEFSTDYPDYGTPLYRPIFGIGCYTNDCFCSIDLDNAVYTTQEECIKIWNRRPTHEWFMD